MREWMRCCPFAACALRGNLLAMTTLTISLPPETAARLEREAQARGVSAETVVAEMIEAWGFDEDDLDLDEDLRRLEEPGENVSVEEAFAELRERVATLRASKG